MRSFLTTVWVDCRQVYEGTFRCTSPATAANRAIKESKDNWPRMRVREICVKVRPLVTVRNAEALD
jgi:hypothetical protein